MRHPHREAPAGLQATPRVYEDVIPLCSLDEMYHGEVQTASYRAFGHANADLIRVDVPHQRSTFKLRSGGHEVPFVWETCHMCCSSCCEHMPKAVGDEARA